MKPTMNATIRHAFVAWCALGALAPGAMAQQQLQAGTYEGSIEMDGGPISQNPRPRMMYVELAIKRVDGASVAGTWSQSSGPCQGEHAVEGRFASGRLFLKTADPGSGACRIPPLQLSAAGDALEGIIAQRELRLRR